MFCAPELIFDGTDGVGSRFLFCRSQTRIRRCEGRRVPFSYFALSDTFRRFRGHRFPFSCFALPYMFSAVARASGPVFKFCALGHVSTVQRASGPIFMFCAPRLVFDDSEGVGSCFHVLRFQTRLRRCGGRRVKFSYFASPYLFSAIPMVSGPIFMFCAPGLFLRNSVVVGSRFHVLRPCTSFQL
jgi:hypothetical protein